MTRDRGHSSSWLLATAVAGVAVALGFAALYVAVTDPGVPAFPTSDLVRGLAGVLAFAPLGALVAARVPRQAAGWLMLAVGLSGGSAVFAATLAHRLLVHDQSSSAGSLLYWLNTWLWVPSYVLVPTWLFLVLPDGVPKGRAWRRVLVLVIAANVLAPLCWAVTPYAEQDEAVPAAYGPITNPVGVEGAGPLLGLGLLLVVAAVAGGVSALVVRLRRASGRERDQLFWVVAGALVTIVLMVLAWLIAPASTLLIAAATVPLPAAITWAMLRRQLWEIDLVVSRTLVYVAMSGLALLVYAALVAVSSNVLSGSTRTPDVVIFAIAAIAVQPLRDLVQRRVNRLLYGDALEPHVAVANLGLRVEAATTAADVLPGVAEVISRTLRAPYVEIRVPGFAPVVRGAPDGTVEPVVLVHRQHRVGELLVSIPRGGFGSRSRMLLDELARQTAVAAHALRLQEELQQSREEIVTSREEERRRMRRNLHDDLGPGVAATAMELDRAAQLVGSNPERASTILMDAAGYLRSTVHLMRSIVDELRPGILDDFGLEGAVREHAARLAESGLEVEVSCSGDLAELPAAVEVAVFRIVTEAMTNVTRHARASRIDIRLVAAGDTLEVSVRDNGTGLGGDARPGVGLESMHQRAAELGGRCVVTGAPGTGTEVRATIPIHAEARVAG